MSILIKDINIEDLQRAMLMFRGHEIVELPDHGDLEAALPVDAVPVVRCKDCKHNYSKKHNKRYNHEDIVCDYFETDGLNDDDFCSYGERSEE